MGEKRRAASVELKLNFLPEGAQPPPRRSGKRAQYEEFVKGLHKAKGVWTEAATFPKGTSAQPLYARASTLRSFENVSAQVRQLPSNHKTHPFGTGLFAMWGSVPKDGKTGKTAKS